MVENIECSAYRILFYYLLFYSTSTEQFLSVTPALILVAQHLNKSPGLFTTKAERTENILDFRNVLEMSSYNELKGGILSIFGFQVKSV